MNLISLPAPAAQSAVVKAAEALGISEYDFFRLAFRRWSGRDAPDDALEPVFVAYMFRRTIPAWVRHLSREVAMLRESGALDPAAFDLGDFKRRQPLPRLGRFSWRLVAAALVLVFLMSLDTTYKRDPTVPLGCPGATGSMFFDRVARAIKRPSDPACLAARDPAPT